MATNCPQQVNPRACRSASCWRTADSNSKREKSWRTCENILQNRFKAEPPEFEIGFLGPNLNLSEAQLFSCDLLRSQFGQQWMYVEWMEFSTLVHHTPMLIGPDPDLHHGSGIGRKLLAVDVEAVLVLCEDDLETRRGFLQSLNIDRFVYRRSLIDIDLRWGDWPSSRT